MCASGLAPNFPADSISTRARVGRPHAEIDPETTRDGLRQGLSAFSMPCKARAESHSQHMIPREDLLLEISRGEIEIVGMTMGCVIPLSFVYVRDIVSTKCTGQ